MGLLWQERPLAVGVDVAFTMVQGLVPATQLLVTQRLLDVVAGAASGAAEWREMVVWIVALAGVSGLQALLEAGRGVARAHLRESAGWRLQQMVIEKAGQAPLEEYEHPAFHDRLQRARQAATWRSFVIFENALRIAEVCVNLASYLVLLVQAHVGLPLILALGAAPNLISQLRRGEERYRLRRRQTPMQRRVDYLVELLTDREAAKELRLYQLGSFLIDTWHDAALSLRNERLQLAKVQQLHVGVGAGRRGAGLCRSDCVAGQTVGVRRHRPGWVCRFNAGRGAVSKPTRPSAPPDRQRVRGVFVPQRPPGVRPIRAGGSGELTLDGSRPFRIEFQGVSFAYLDGPEVLRDVSFTIHPGEKVTLIGTNGAGKTTLIKLMLGLYTPDRGRILIDGEDLARLDPESHRRHVAAVFQDYLRYQLTARDNIGFGQADRLDDDARILDAAAKAGADAVVSSLSAGLDTTLGRTFEGGQDLSGGQWQKITIARAYFRDAKVLVLDEPTAALDARAELEIFEQFRALAGDRTAVFVSHRMASARIADRILVLESGRLIENGSHDELVAAGGEYARMFEMQAKWYRSGLDPAVTYKRQQGGESS